MALTLDHLRDIEHHLRGADTFALRQFWKPGGNGVRSPIVENDCRDILLGKLRDRLAPLGVQVVSERRAADDKRADLRVDFIANGQHLAVPVEIKKEDHHSLWLGWRDQLQSLYANDPAADGHGIYLVLWFGQTPRSSPEGERPASAGDLGRRLTERIPSTDRVRLAVLVLDLSLPS